MKPDDSDLIFIIGHYKSGSSWLLNMLALHPAIRAIQETHVFHHLCTAPCLRRCTEILCSSVPWSGGGLRQLPRHRLSTYAARPLARWSPALSLSPRDRPITLLDLPLREQLVLRQELNRCSSSEEYCRVFFDFHWRCLQPERCLVEKTPNNLHYASDIKRVFPKCKLVAIYRDGRDVVVSARFFQTCYKRLSNWSFRQAVLRWRDDIERQAQVRALGDLYTLSYEDLVRSPRPTLRRLLQYLGLPTEAETLSDMVARSSFRFRTGREPGQENRLRFSRKGIIGDWRNHFGPQEKRTFKELAGDQLVALGYETSHEW